MEQTSIQPKAWDVRYLLSPGGANRDRTNSANLQISEYETCNVLLLL